MAKKIADIDVRCRAEPLLSDFIPPEIGRKRLRSYSDVPRRYMGTRWGRHHSRQLPRFSARYAYQPNLMRADLGWGVDPVYHGSHVRSIFQILAVGHILLGGTWEVEPWKIPAAAIALESHDYGENTHRHIAKTGGVVGDPERGKKTPDMRTRERQIHKDIMTSKFRVLPTPVMDFVLAYVGKELPAEDRCLIDLGHYAHEAGEQENSFKAAQTYERLALASDQDPLDAHRLRMLAQISACLQDPRAALVQGAVTYPVIGHLLEVTEPGYRHAQSLQLLDVATA